MHGIYDPHSFPNNTTSFLEFVEQRAREMAMLNQTSDVNSFSIAGYTVHIIIEKPKHE